jgi:cell filamentation protein
MADRYLQKDGKTLKNKLGVFHDPDALAAKEAVHVNSRMMELRAAGFPQAEGFELVKAVHRYLFQDVYDWAGQLRETKLARATYADGHGEFVRFTEPSRIDPEGHQLFAELAAANHLRGLARAHFGKELAQFFGRLNQLHPFREGNGRTQRLVWEHLAKQAGHDLSFEGISRERMVNASIAASSGDYEPARRIFNELLDPVRSQALRAATRFLEAHRNEVNWQERYVATTEPGRSYAGTFVGAGGPNFMMHDGKNIYVGNLTDLPNQGHGLHSGDRVSFRTGPAEQAHETERAQEKQREKQRSDREKDRDYDDSYGL